MNEITLQKTDSVLVVGQSKDFRVLEIDHVQPALKALDIPEEVITHIKPNYR